MSASSRAADLAGAPFDEGFVDAMVQATSDRPMTPGLSGHVALGVGSKVDAAKADVVVSIRDGRVVGSSDETAEAVVILSRAQVEAWTAGAFVPSEAYMRGDLKPTGASGPLFAALETLDWLAASAS